MLENNKTSALVQFIEALCVTCWIGYRKERKEIEKYKENKGLYGETLSFVLVK